MHDSTYCSLNKSWNLGGLKTRSGGCIGNISLACIFEKFQIPKRRAHHPGSLFPDDYEYLNQFSPARPDIPKFYVKSLKITLYGCFQLVLILMIANNFKVMHA